MQNSKINIVITGGGTGGHIYPAIAVAQSLKDDKDVEKISYIGCAKNMEKGIAEKEGLNFFSINVSGMPRKASIKFILWLLELFIAVINSIFLLLKIRPDIVFGTGGYVTAPVLTAAKILSIPFVIHDPDAHPGIVNRAMAPYAKVVSTAFCEAKTYLKSENIIFNGNPVRASLSGINKNEALIKLGLSANKKTIIAIGGSQGAKTINDSMFDAVPVLIEEFGVQVIHQTGRKNFDDYLEAFTQKYPHLRESSDYIVKPYFENMELPLNAADIAISRAGSLSLSELSLCGLPSILVPYPYAAADHQRFNAKAMERAGASIFLDDKECSSEKIIKIIGNLLQEEKKLSQMKSASLNLAKPKATENIIKIIKTSI